MISFKNKSKWDELGDEQVFLQQNSKILPISTEIKKSNNNHEFTIHHDLQYVVNLFKSDYSIDMCKKFIIGFMDT